MSKKILGISAFYHDSAACLVIGGKVIAAAQEERFTRKKHTPDFPINAIKYCLEEGGLTIDELDAIQLSIYPNPVKANGQLFISDDSNISSIRLIDFSGRVVQQWSEVKGFINLDQAVTGVYLLSIQTLNGSEVTKKVIIE